jgi:23S rRNA (pseudouridine1915-N3)-methyltransferase
VKLAVVAVGRLKDGPERDLVTRYRERLEALGRAHGITRIELVEIPESRARREDDRRAEEADAIRRKTGTATLVVLDERAPSCTSEAFAGHLRSWRDANESIALVIGGPDGLDPALRDGARLPLSFGALTLPHQLVRVLAVEQLYRALTIVAGHPYHRAGSEA